MARRTTRIWNERRAKVVVASLYASGGIAVLVFLAVRESFPPIGLWLAFAAAFAFFDWRSVEVNDRLLMSPTVMVGLTAAVAFGPGSAALGVATMAALGAVSARDVRERRIFQPVANFGQLVVTAAISSLTVEIFLRIAQASGAGAFWAWVALGSAIAAAVHASINYAFVAFAVRTVFRQNVKPWSHMSELLPSYVAMGFVGGLLGATITRTEVVLPLVFIVFIIGYQAFASFGQLREAHAATLRGFVKALEAKDLYTRGHTERVAQFSVLCGQQMGFRGTRLERLEWAALIHDVGKLAVPRDLIRKRGRLTTDEYSELQRHAHMVEEILAEVEFLRPMVEIASAHHSSYDGSGYGGTGHTDGQEPSLEACILAVADAFDAMTSTRSYRMALSQSYAFSELRRNAGKQFNPEVVETFIAAMEGTNRRYGSPYLHDPVEARRLAEGKVETHG
ncbi:cyclic di-GMP phosphodiesterase response regulator RpfG [bacterium BMS3Abin02]|nr:cyclic di-GMP phosphodiesterase response regulator RpfG [bacterium BMS3Abin02]HDH27251.1 HD domain-containing protein [Actinomycetota bacterium]